MAEGGIIYTKTIDASVQDGIDNNLIIQPNYAYQKEFSFGDDWTEIFVGMFFSYTDSVTLNNEAFASAVDKNSGGTSNDTFTYMGIIKNNDTKYLPDFSAVSASSSQSFAGIATNYIYQPHLTFSSSGYNALSNGAGLDTVILGGNNASHNLSTVGGEGLYIPFMYADQSTLFASYVGIKFTVLNKGLSNQQVRIRQFSNNSGAGNNILAVSFTDISLANLKTLINAELYSTDGDVTMDFNDGASALPLPDAFFFYNAFVDVRPRIHAVAAKKIS